MERHVRSEGKIYSNFLVPVNFQKTVPGFGKFATLCCCNEAHENFNLWLARSHRLLNQIDLLNHYLVRVQFTFNSSFFNIPRPSRCLQVLPLKSSPSYALSPVTIRASDLTQLILNNMRLNVSYLTTIPNRPQQIFPSGVTRHYGVGRISKVSHLDTFPLLTLTPVFNESDGY